MTQRKESTLVPPLPRKPKRDAAGRPAFQKTEEQAVAVEKLSGLGLPHEQICHVIYAETKGVKHSISRDTLEKYFEEELRTGKAKANAQVATSLFNNAVKHNNVAAQIWWSKSQLRWKETQTVEHTGADGGAIKIDSSSLKGLSDQELEALETLLAKTIPK